MCGIAAIFGFKIIHNLPLLTKMMTDVIQHRGPDDEGIVLFSQEGDPAIFGGKNTPESVFKENLSYCPKDVRVSDGSYFGAFGHRRLSIIDLSPAGHQPMSSEDKLLWVTYNGEIYNYIELRQNLESIGYKFQTQSDTEVIIKAFQEWGVDSFSHFNGMFSFVLFDREKRRVFAVRDRFGVKPLYYWKSSEGFVAFASEIKQFLGLPGWKAKLNGQRGYDFLNWGVFDHSNETLFSEVYQVPGGHYLRLDLDKIVFPKYQILKWYHLHPSPFRGSFQDATSSFLDLLTDSIKLRLRADVDVGSCLSGGLDSSTIVCLANQYLQIQNKNHKQRTFSACSEIPRFDERSYVEQVVNQTNVEAHYIYPSARQLFDDILQITWHQDEPFGSTSIFAQWSIFKMVNEQKVKVMLDGQGADEQLAGYLGFFGNRLYDLLTSLRWISLFRELRATKKTHNGVNPLPSLVNKLVPNILRQPVRRLMGKTATRPDWLNIELIKAEDRNPWLSGSNKSVAEQSMEQITKSNLPMLLHYEDRNSMAHSIESRTPFLDYRLVEFCLGLPSDYKIANGWTKRILRESTKGVIPDSIRRRKDKMGFVTAEEIWLKKEYSDLFRRSIDDGIEMSKGILKPNVREYVNQMIKGDRPFSHQVWRWISFGKWVERFSVEKP